MTRETCEFQAALLDWKQIHALPDAWPTTALLALLANLEVDDVSETDALDMALMALQDLEPDDASDRVLETIFGDGMRPGVRQNLAQDLTEERPWEEFADLTQQLGIFNAVVLLQQAFPREFDKPDAVSVTIQLDTPSTKGRAWLDAPSPDPALVLRILAGGMDDRSLLRRLFGESLRGPRFPEAGAILWHVSPHAVDGPGHQFTVLSSHQWFDALKDAERWTAEAWVDAPPRAY